jgi:hypothetical protein
LPFSAEAKDGRPVVLGLERGEPFQLLGAAKMRPRGLGEFGGRALTPDPVDERRLRDRVTWFEREGDQQPAQPGARHVGEDAGVRANLEGSEHPDVHLADFAMGDWQASVRRCPSEQPPDA